MVCQAHCDMVQRGIDFSYSSGKVCSPVISAVKANSPFPIDSGANGSSFRRIGLCRLTRVFRSMRDSEIDLPELLAGVPVAAAAPSAIPRKRRRDKVIASSDSKSLTGNFTGKLPGHIKEKPGSLPERKLPGAEGPWSLELEDELRHELTTARVVLLVRRNGLPERAGRRVNNDLGVAQAAAVKQRMVECVNEFQS